MTGRDLHHRLPLIGVVSALAGLLVAAIVAPFVGGLAVVARAQADAFDRLPSELQTPPLPQASRLLSADGHTIATFFDENRVVVPESGIAPAMRYAIIAIEDYRFYEHRGLDLQGAVRAALNNAGGGAVQGGSTITQQYVKNVLVEQAAARHDTKDAAAARSQSVARKLRELRYALTLEQRLGKDEILTRYLNIAYFGDGAYGVEAAARHFFGTSAAKLTLAQAALLAGLVKSPVEYNPARHPKAARARRDTVLDQMAKYRFAAPAAVDAAKATSLGLHLSRQVNGCVTSLAPWFCDYVLAYFRTHPELGGERALRAGGLVVRTSLDVKAQKAAQAAVDAHVNRRDRVAAALAMVEPGTGHVLALAESRDYAKYQVNLTVGHPYSDSDGGQPGSTFKPFTLAAALDQGIPVRTRIVSPPKYHSDLFHYDVPNAQDSEACTCDLLTGTWRSVNTFYVQLEERVGLKAAQGIAEDLGARRADARPWQAQGSWTLGTDEVAPLDMANAYATLAAHGVRCTPTPLLGIRTLAGRTVAVPDPGCDRTVDAGVADTVTSILRGVVDGPDPLRTGKAASLGRPVAGKTGTNTDYKGAWFVGYTPQIATAVGLWDPQASQTPLKDVTIGGHHFVHVFGADVPAPIFRDAMVAALRGRPVEGFPPPVGSVAEGTTTGVPDVSGLAPSDAVATLRGAGFDPVVRRRRVASDQSAGLVAYTSPAAGSPVPAGTLVVVYVSDGVPPDSGPANPLPLVPVPAVTPTPATRPSAGPAPTPSGRPAPRPSPRPAPSGPPPKPAPSPTPRRSP